METRRRLSVYETIVLSNGGLACIMETNATDALYSRDKYGDKQVTCSSHAVNVTRQITCRKKCASCCLGHMRDD